MHKSVIFCLSFFILSSHAFEEILLVDGTWERRTFVSQIMVRILSLAHEDPIAFYDFIATTRNSSHINESHSPIVYFSSGLNPHDESTKKIIKLIIRGDGFDMKFHSPFAHINNSYFVHNNPEPMSYQHPWSIFQGPTIFFHP